MTPEAKGDTGHLRDNAQCVFTLPADAYPLLLYFSHDALIGDISKGHLNPLVGPAVLMRLGKWFSNSTQERKINIETSLCIYHMKQTLTVSRIFEVTRLGLDNHHMKNMSKEREQWRVSAMD